MESIFWIFEMKLLTKVYWGNMDLIDNIYFWFESFIFDRKPSFKCLKIGFGNSFGWVVSSDYTPRDTEKCFIQNFDLHYMKQATSKK